MFVTHGATDERGLRLNFRRGLCLATDSDNLTADDAWKTGVEDSGWNYGSVWRLKFILVLFSHYFSDWPFFPNVFFFSPKGKERKML
jgi:hypothetical protein